METYSTTKGRPLADTGVYSCFHWVVRAQPQNTSSPRVGSSPRGIHISIVFYLPFSALKLWCSGCQLPHSKSNSALSQEGGQGYKLFNLTFAHLCEYYFLTGARSISLLQPEAAFLRSCLSQGTGGTAYSRFSLLYCSAAAHIDTVDGHRNHLHQNKAVSQSGAFNQ